MAKKELLLGAAAAGLLLSGIAAPAFAAKGEGKHHQRHAAMIERLDADKNGKVVYSPDIYNRDPALISALAAKR